jgi:hypothetical protein
MFLLGIFGSPGDCLTRRCAANEEKSRAPTTPKRALDDDRQSKSDNRPLPVIASGLLALSR